MKYEHPVSTERSFEDYFHASQAMNDLGSSSPNAVFGQAFISRLPAQTRPSRPETMVPATVEASIQLLQGRIQTQILRPLLGAATLDGFLHLGMELMPRFRDLSRAITVLLTEALDQNENLEALEAAVERGIQEAATQVRAVLGEDAEDEITFDARTFTTARRLALRLAAEQPWSERELELVREYVGYAFVHELAVYLLREALSQPNLSQAAHDGMFILLREGALGTYSVVRQIEHLRTEALPAEPDIDGAGFDLSLADAVST